MKKVYKMKEFKMKAYKIWLICAIAGLFAGCSNDEPAQDVFHHSKHDEAVLAKIRKACGIMKDDGETRISVGWKFVNLETLDQQIVALGIEKYDGKSITVPEVVTELEWLESLAIRGPKIEGEMPDILNSIPKLNKFEISNTNITSLNDNIFTGTNLKYISIRNNKMLTSLPASFSSLKIINPSSNTWTDNGLTGSAPVYKDMWPNFIGNNFETIDWQQAEGVFYNLTPEDWTKWERGYGCLYNNRLRGEIPDYILNDTLGMLVLFRTVDGYRENPQNGYGFSNMPDGDKIFDNAAKFIDSHPEYWSKQ